jgi:hypothetical protein
VAEYRASSLGTCDKALVAEQLGFTPIAPPTITRLRMHEGELHEPDVIGRLMKDGWMIGSQQKEVRIQVTDRLCVTGHLDALRLHRNGEPYGVIEVKSQSADAWETLSNTTLKRAFNGDDPLWTKYGWQVSCYMIATGLPAFVVRKNRNDGRLTVDKVHNPPHSEREVRARVLSLDAQVRRGELPDRCPVRQDYSCPFRYLHEEVPREELDDLAVDALAQSLVDARDERKVAEAKEGEARRRLMEALGDALKVETRSGIQVTRYETVRTTWDHTGLLDQYPAAKEFMSTKKSWQVRVAVPQELEPAE